MRLPHAAHAGPREVVARRLALGFWSCVGLAALTKGPPALTLVVWAPLAARLASGRGVARRFGWTWGPVLALAIPGVWLSLAWRADPGHVQHLFQDARVDAVYESGYDTAYDGKPGSLEAAQ